MLEIFYQNSRALFKKRLGNLFLHHFKIILGGEI